MTALALAARRPSPWPVLGAVVGCLAALVVVRITWHAAGGDVAVAPGEGPARGVVAAYEAALEPLLEDAGFVVAQGVRPGVGDVAEGRLPAEVLTTMATGWAAELRAARAAVAALPRHRGLDGVAAAYDRALAAYVEVAEVLREAAAAGGSRRQALLDRVADLGPVADRLYDDARAALEALAGTDHRGAPR